MISEKFSILCGNIIEATGLKEVSFSHLGNLFLWNSELPGLLMKEMLPEYLWVLGY